MSQTALTLTLSPQSCLDTYIRRIQQFPMLSVEEEQSLAQDFCQTGNLESARKLVMSHLRFVVRIAKGYSGYGLPQADLIQEGNVGLMKAVKRFNPTLGVRLVSFAAYWIKAEIHEYVLRNWRIVRVATTKAQRKLFFNLRKTKQRLGWFNQNERAAVAKELGVSHDAVAEMETRLNSSDLSLSYSEDDGQDDSFQPAPLLCLEDKHSDFAHHLEEENWTAFATAKLSQALAQLDERSQQIVRARWLENKKVSLQELAEHFKVSAERIRQLESNALKKLRQTIT